MKGGWGIKYRLAAGIRSDLHTLRSRSSLGWISYATREIVPRGAGAPRSKPSVLKSSSISGISLVGPGYVPEFY